MQKRGHGRRTSERRAQGPFAAVAPAVAVAATCAAIAMVWVIAGRSLPGGRWFPVHLFTLGVLTNLVLAFTLHFGRTLTRTMDEPVRWQLPVVNLGVVAVLGGRATDTVAAVGIGATIVTGVVVASWWRLRSMRHRAVGARFGWIVRVYERAHGAFVHGAVLGVLLGLGVLPGTWFVAARTAHLHVMVLGWGGLTLLGTIVFFGPTVARIRIVPGADERAARWLRMGATALTVAVLLLLATGLGGPLATSLRLFAAAALAVFAVAVTSTCVPVVQAARAAKPSVPRGLVLAVGCWFPVAVWVDVVVVTTGRWDRLDALGLAMLLGVLLQAIVATLTFVAPSLRGRTAPQRDRLLARLDTAARTRTAAFNLGIALVVVAAALRTPEASPVARAGWFLVLATIVHLATMAIAPLRAHAPS